MPTPKRTHIVSTTPTRTRLKVSEKRRNPQEMGRIAKALKAKACVHDVRTNLQTGSIVIHHGSKPSSLENIALTLRDLGVILGHVTDAEIPLSSGEKSAVANDLTAAITDLNQKVGQATNGLVDLRMIVPLGFGALAVRQLLRQGFQIETAPWYALAYYAFDSFIKLHYTHDPEDTKQ